MNRVIRAAATVIYYGVARYLPRSYLPGGAAATALRVWCARMLCERVGEGSVIEPHVDFGSGRFLSLGDRSGIGPRSTVGALSVGDDVMIGPELLAISQNHRFDDAESPIRLQGDDPVEPVVIGDGAWIGARVILLPGVRVGPGAVVGAGSVVTRDVPEYSVVAGNPARIIRERRCPPCSSGDDSTR